MLQASVIVPLYNSEEYIEQCLAGIVEQTIREIEVILVVREGSDATWDICIRWSKKDDRIKVLLINEAGLGCARNYGLRVARGKYIAYIDADDSIEADYLEKMIKPLEGNESISVSCCGFNRIWDNGRTTDGWLPSVCGLEEVNWKRYRELIYYGTVWLKVYRRDFLLKNDLYQFEGCHEDDAMHLMIASVVEKVFFIQEPLYHYYCDNTKSLTHNKENDLQYYDAIEFAIEYLIERGTFQSVRWDIYHCIRNTSKRLLAESCDLRHIEKEERLLKTYFEKELYISMCREENGKRSFSKEIVIFGYGADGKAFLRDINKSKICAIIDNNCLGNKEVLDDIPIYTLEEYVKCHDDTDIVICSSRYYAEMEEMLVDNGIKYFYSVDEYKKKIMQRKR